MRKLVLLGAVAVLVVVVAVAAGGWWYAHRTTTTPVSPDQAVERYEEGTSSSTAAASTTDTRPSSTSLPAATPSTDAPTTVPTRLPDPGVYLYTTTGSDSVDALGGASHGYPATTTITVEVAGCGVSQQWLALEERWDRWTSCTDAHGFVLQGFTGFHVFFGQGTTDEWACSGEARPAQATAGTTWQATCVEAGVSTVWRGTVVGADSLVVGSQTVPVQHVRIDLDDGVPTDRQQYEAWYLEGTDLLVRQTADVETSNSSAVGTVTYREQYTIDLVSLTPRT